MGSSGAGVIALLDSLSFPELMTILAIALIVLGPEKLPGMARSAGRWMHKLRTLTANLQEEVRDVMDDPQMQPLRELGEFAASPRRKLAEYAAQAAAEEQAEQERAQPEPAAPSPHPMDAAEGVEPRP